MKKLFRKIHLWLSVPFGIFITLICFSGAMLVFEKEITELCRPDLYFVKEVKEKPLPLDSLMEKVAATLPDSVDVTGVTISPDAERAWQVSLSKPRRASVYIDQYTGEVKGRSERLPFYDTMFHLHRWMLGDSSGFGKLLVGISTLMLVIILITGILMWLTNRHKPLKKSLTISFTKGWPRFWHDLHVAGGIYATIFLLALALTGLTWSFSWYRTGFYAMFGVEASAGGHGGGHDGKPEGKGSRRGNGENHREGQRGDREKRGRHGGRGEYGGGRVNGDGGKHHRRDDGGKPEAAVPEKTAEKREGKRRNGNTEEHRPRTERNSDNGNAARMERTEEPAAGTQDVQGTTAATAKNLNDGEGGERRRERHGRGGADGYRHRHAQDSTGGYTRRHRPDSIPECSEDHETAAADAAERKDKERNVTGERKDRDRGDRSRSFHNGGGKRNERGGAGRNGKDARGEDAYGHRTRRDSVSTEPADTAVNVQEEASVFAHWQDVYTVLSRENPGFQQITVSDGSASIVPEGRMSLRAGDKYGFDPLTGKITDIKPYREQEKSAKVRSGIYMLHVGSWGGIVTRIITFLAALLGATLPLTGYYLWIRKLMGKRRRQKEKE